MKNKLFDLFSISACKIIMTGMVLAMCLVPSKSVMAADAPNTYADALEVAPNTRIEDSITDTDNADWFTFTTTNETVYYTFEFFADTDVKNSNRELILYVYEPSRLDRPVISPASWNNQTVTESIKLEKNQKYYVCVKKQPNTVAKSYYFTFTTTKEEADSMEDAPVIKPGVSVSGKIDVKNDMDYYKVDPGCSGRITVKAEAVSVPINVILLTANENIEYADGEIPRDGIDGTIIDTVRTHMGVPAGEACYIAIYKRNSTYNNPLEYTISYTAEVFNDSGTAGDTFTGLRQANDGNWYLYDNGKINTNYNDLYLDAELGWWKIASGRVDFEYDDLYCSPTLGWWKINHGTVDFAYTGLYCSPSYGWWLVGGGAVAFGYNDLWGDPVYGWWKIVNGTVDFGYTGLYESPTCGWWLVGGGNVAFWYDDLWCDPILGWWKVSGGSVDFGYTGYYNSPTCGTWHITNGMLY